MDDNQDRNVDIDQFTEELPGLNGTLKLDVSIMDKKDLERFRIEISNIFHNKKDLI